MQSFFTINKETFPLFLCSYRDTQFFETGPRKSTITEISTINNTIELSILRHGNFKIKVILGMKVYSHCNKSGGSIFHQSQFSNKTFRNIVIFEISNIFLSILQKLSNFKKSTFSVKSKYFLGEYKNSTRSFFFFFCFGQGIVFHSPKHNTKHLYQKKKSNGPQSANAFERGYFNSRSYAFF